MYTSKIKSYVKAKSLSHAYQIIKGDKSFPDWTSRELILLRANLFFKDGSPYKNALNSITQELSEIKVIRNSIVHMSISSQEKFKSLVRTTPDLSPNGTTAGKFLLSIKNRPQETYIEYYAKTLKNTAKFISEF